MEAEFGRPPREAGTACWLTLTWNGEESEFPDTTGANTTASLHRPGAGLSVCSWAPTWLSGGEDEVAPGTMLVA